MSILRSLGIKHGYYTPSDWKTAYYTDVIVDCWVDVFDSMGRILFGMMDASEEEKTEEITKTIKTIHVPMLGLMEKHLEDLGGPFIAGEKLTIADCCCASAFFNIW